jgi:hypothetical protein
MLRDDRSRDRKGPAGIYGEMAQTMLDASTKVVVMGHTHEARDCTYGSKGQYINTGTWVDVIRFPENALADDDALDTFLRALVADTAREHEPTYADVLIRGDGTVEHARLHDA